ncbi:MAG: hypothetical protein ACTSQE_14130 [Candidatus Heimdallarchaeaceae archaeon]
MSDIEDERKVSIFLKIISAFLAILLFPIVALSRLLLILSYILIPRSITELVPALNIQRKYLLYLSTILASKEKKELVGVQESVDSILLKQEKIRDAYPIQRSVGELFDKFSTFSLFVLLPILVWKQPFLEKFSYVNPLILILVFSTVQGMLSAITASFGPFFRLFHRMSLLMLKFKAYWSAYYYQKLEDLFALPFLASRSSYRFIDAPPISAETYEDFKVDLYEDVEKIKQKIQDLLSFHGSTLSKESKELCKTFLIQIDKDPMYFEEVEASVSRMFALLIWKRQISLFPWRKNPGLKKFAKQNNMTYKEAKKTLFFVASKLKDKFISDEFYQSILLTGALRGICNLESKYEQTLSDVELNQLAFSLALGGQKYIIDTFEKQKFGLIVLIKLRNLILTLLAPILVIFDILIDYLKHIKRETTFFLERSKGTSLLDYIKSRFKEMRTELLKKLTSSDDEEKEKSVVDGAKRKNLIKMIYKFGKLIAQIILALPLSLYYIIRAMVSIFNISKWKKKTKEEIMERKFERDLATETLASMYQEIYDKLVLQTYYYS